MSSIRTVALAAARAAGAAAMRRFGRRLRVELKHSAVDLVTDADRSAERAALRVVRDAFPAHVFFGEEGAPSARRLALEAALAAGAFDDDDVWLVDPIDGTTNFAHAIPHWAVSVAFASRGALRVGVVLNPATGEEWVAEAGRGCTLGGRRVRVSAPCPLGETVLATGFPYDRATNPDDNHAEFVRLNLATRGVRRFGAASLDLAFVACGRYDAYWEKRLKPWDVAAGALCVTEAGGVVSDLAAGATWPSGDQIAAASHGALLERLLAEVGAAAQARVATARRPAPGSRTRRGSGTRTGGRRSR